MLHALRRVSHVKGLQPVAEPPPHPNHPKPKHNPPNPPLRDLNPTNTPTLTPTPQPQPKPKSPPPPRPHILAVGHGLIVRLLRCRHLRHGRSRRMRLEPVLAVVPRCAGSGARRAALGEKGGAKGGPGTGEARQGGWNGGGSSGVGCGPDASIGFSSLVGWFGG